MARRIDKLTEIAKKHAREIVEEVNDDEGYELKLVSCFLCAYIIISESSLWD